MSGRFENLPDDVRAALERGEIIDAIKRLRMATGLGLKEAKDVIDSIVAGRPPAPRPTVTTSLPHLPFDGTLPADVLVVLATEGKIAAIKLLRERTGLGLKEAKDAIEAAPAPPRAPSRAPPTVAPAAKPAARTPTIVDESSLRWVSVVLVLLAVALVAGILWLLQ